MKNTSIRNGINTGIIFGVIILTMFLIGFTIIGAELVAKLLGQSSSGTPSVAYSIIFMIIIGLWSGSTAAKRPLVGKDSIKDAVTAGLFAGLITGVISAVIGMLFGSVAPAEMTVLRSYLVSVSPDSINLFLFGQGAVAGSLMVFGILFLSGISGALLSVITRNSDRLKNLLADGRTKSISFIGSPRVVAFSQNQYARYGMLLLAAILLIIIPRWWGSYWNYVFGTIGIYVILGIGLNIITGWSGQLVLGYVSFFAVGAYTFALLTAPAPHHLEWNFWIALLVAVSAAGLSGLLIGLPILNLRGDYLAIVTLGFAEIIRIMLKSDLMTEATGGPRGLQGVGGPSIFGMSLNNDIDFMYLIIVAVIVISFIAKRLQNSRPGRAWYAINLDETVARATGVNAFRSKLVALTISAVFAGLAGALFASRNQYTGPDDHVLMVSVNVLCLLIVGGIGNIPGIFLGAFVLKGIPEILREVENYRMLVFGVLLVIMMRIRPEGFLPSRRPALEQFSAQNSENSSQPAKEN